MKILVADTSSSVCAVGVFDNDKIITQNILDNGKTHSENFMPLIEKTLNQSEIKLNDIDCIGVVTGPGSFTGIRIGIASCKAMAEVKNIKMISVSSLESLAGNELGKSEIICSMVDARNNQVYCGIYDEDINLKEELIADDISIVLEKLKKYNNIKDISCLAEMKNLEGLGLANNNIKDLSPLSGLTNLGTLDLYANVITDLKPLKKLINLVSLRLDHNGIYDLKPLESLSYLTSLTLKANYVTDVKPLLKLKNLIELRLVDTPIENIEVLEPLDVYEKLTA